MREDSCDTSKFDIWPEQENTEGARVDLSDKLFDAVLVNTVMPGHCLVTAETDFEIKILFVGPIGNAPDVEGKKVYLNEVDFNRLKAIVMKRAN